MLTLNSVLRYEGLDVSGVRLVRHQYARNPRRPTPYMLWQVGDGRLELYQRIQRRKVFQPGDRLASFVVTPMNQTLFIGLYVVEGLGTAPAGLIDPIVGHDVGGLHLYEIRPTNLLDEYSGHLIIDWGPGHRSWVQRADRQEKPILEIRSQIDEPRFPGFTNFAWDLDELPSVPPSWQQVLRSVKGVYALVCLETGAQYVGSAKGEDNLWGRFMDYFETGHGGNVELRRRGRKRYQVTVLEVVNSDLAIEATEEAWKRKLLTRDFGLNKN